MKIGIIGSMQYTEKMMKIRDKLLEMGHDAFLTNLAEPFVGKSDEKKEKIKIYQKQNKDAIRGFWRLMQGVDAVLVVNLDKHGIKNYIGGNTLMEIGFAHVLN
jgi:dsDNA-binding SOS-regulon protein